MFHRNILPHSSGLKAIIDIYSCCKFPKTENKRDPLSQRFSTCRPLMCLVWPRILFNSV